MSTATMKQELAEARRKLESMQTHKDIESGSWGIVTTGAREIIEHMRTLYLLACEQCSADARSVFDQLATEGVVRDLGPDATDAERMEELERMSDRLDAALSQHVQGRLGHEGHDYTTHPDKQARELNAKLTRVNLALALYGEETDG